MDPERRAILEELQRQNEAFYTKVVESVLPDLVAAGDAGDVDGLKALTGLPFDPRNAGQLEGTLYSLVRHATISYGRLLLEHAARNPGQPVQLPRLTSADYVRFSEPREHQSPLTVATDWRPLTERIVAYAASRGRFAGIGDVVDGNCHVDPRRL